MVKLVSHGILLDDIVYPDGQTQMAVLGGGGPQTVWGMAAALGSGQGVGLIAALHNDEDMTILEPLRAAGIDLQGIYHNALPTPRAWQILEYSQLRRHVWRVPVETLNTQLRRGLEVAPVAYHDAQYFHWGIHPGDAEADKQWAKALVKQGINVCLEPFRPSPQPLSLGDLRALLAHCDVFSANIYEARQISGFDDEAALLARFKEAGAHYLLVRRSEDGADCWNLRDGVGVSVQAYPADVVDVVGAGNAFTGAFLARLADGIDVAACHASAAASYMIEQVGIPHGLPQPDDYDKRLAYVRERVVRRTLADVGVS